MSKQTDKFSVYFKCDHCPQEFSLYSFRIAVFLYGVILLANEQNRYMGITCPRCMKTTLRKVEQARLKEIEEDLGKRIVIIYDLEQEYGHHVTIKHFGKPQPQSVI